MPPGRLFVGVRDTAQRRLAQVTADQLQTVRRVVRREAARERDGRRAEPLCDRCERSTEVSYRVVAHPVHEGKRRDVRGTHEGIDRG